MMIRTTTFALAMLFATMSLYGEELVTPAFESDEVKQALARYRERLAFLDAKLNKEIDAARDQLRGELESALAEVVKRKDFSEAQRLSEFLHTDLDNEISPESDQATNLTKIDGIKKWKGHRYLRVDDKTTARVAAQRGDKLGAHLARINTEDELKFLQSLVQGGFDYYFIDGNDEEREGEWVYSNTNRIAFLQWGRDQPDDDSQPWYEHQLVLNSRDGLMGDISGGQRLGYILEWDTAVEP